MCCNECTPTDIIVIIIIFFSFLFLFFFKFIIIIIIIIVISTQCCAVNLYIDCTILTITEEDYGAYA